MRWQGQRESDNVEDRRGGPRPQMLVGGGMGMIIVVIVIALLGGDPLAFLQQVNNGPQIGVPQQQPMEEGANDEVKQFVSVVLADTEDVWTAEFRKLGREYRAPRLVLFSSQVRSGCGIASAGVGPFYCPADETVYLDPTFFEELRSRFHAPGDFAQAYVIAHEIGHHVQKLLGTSDVVHEARGRVSKEEYNQLSVRLELQADFLAGVWANHAQRARQIIEAGDVEEALGAANAIGDDRLQKQAQGYVVPDSFTHGTSAQRVRWFRRGLETGDIEQGDTFNARDL